MPTMFTDGQKETRRHLNIPVKDSNKNKRKLGGAPSERCQEIFNKHGVTLKGRAGVQMGGLMGAGRLGPDPTNPP